MARRVNPPARRGTVLPRTIRGRRRLRNAVIVLAAALAGYLLTCAVYPTPVRSSDVASARVIGLPQAVAQKELVAQGFRVRVDTRDPDPVFPLETVLWQDPAAETRLPRGAVVTLVISAGPQSIGVPDVSGLEAIDASRILEASGFAMGATDSIPAAAEAGIVVATRPASGDTRLPGSPVALVVSRGPPDARVPSVLGMQQADARLRLESSGFHLGLIRAVTSRRPIGLVLEQHPAAGALAPRGTRVDLAVSSRMEAR